MPAGSLSSVRTALVGAAAIFAPSSGLGADISLSAPVACPAGVICPVQNLFDHDPGAGFRDYRCTALGYDGHDGTDVRAPTTALQRAGIEVRAAADGVAIGVRDGMADVGIAGAGGREALKGVECGNGVVLRHFDGWDTQYCHMAKGSIAVRQGEQVKRGQRLGAIGLSGMTEFPHLHFSLRQNGRMVDPYALDGPSAACGDTRSAWDAEAQGLMRPEAPMVLNSGFSDRPVPAEDIESGAAQERAPARDPAALVAYGRAIGLATGDGLRVSLLAPGGGVLARNEIPPAPNAKAQVSVFAGRKRPPDGWPAGSYRGRVEILRAGKPLKATEFTLDFGGG